ncbi:MAG: L,D-transpeptidase [Pseudomonadota bacterium]
MFRLTTYGTGQTGPVLQPVFKALAVTGAVVAGIALFAQSADQANADQRYATPPPITLSSDLTSPWTIQLRDQPRRVRKKASRYQRQGSVKRWKKKKYQRVQTPRVQQASLATSSGLRSSIATVDEASLAPLVVNFNGAEKPGTIIVNTPERRLYLVLPGGKARRYAIGVGKPGFEWAGRHKVTRKKEWPSWRPPAEMIARERAKGRDLPAFMEGGLDNPLGARALYLGSTLYRIHGTNQAWSIGQAVSSGCIRMRNEDVMDLYDRVPVGASVRVI